MAENMVIRESPMMIPMIMRAHWKSREPFHLCGEPSTTKSALIKQTSLNINKEENDGRSFIEWNQTPLKDKFEIYKNPAKYFIFADFRASETDIGELRLQEMHKEQDFITYKYNLLFVVLSNPDSKGVLFFDEMNLAPDMIKAQFYKVYNDRAIGDLPLSNGVLICSAGNESTQVRSIVPDSVALTTRRGNYFLSPLTSKEFTEYGFETGIHSSIVGYLSFAPQDIHDLKYDLGDPIGQPCARTWEKLSNIINTNPSMTMDDRSIIARAFIGSIATKYIAYSRVEERLNLADVIKDPTKAKAIKELQMQYALVCGLIGTFKQNDESVFPKICEISLYIKEEIGVYMLRMVKKLCKNDKYFEKLALEKYAESFDDCFKKFGDLLRG